MAEFDSRSPINLKDFERYQSGKMSYQEQYAFEKRLLAEPAFADAYAGFKLLNPSAEKAAGLGAEFADRLAVRIGQKRSKKLGLLTYASAAAVLITAGTFWIVFTQNKEETKVTQKASVKDQPAVVPQKITPNYEIKSAETASSVPQKRKSPPKKTANAVQAEAQTAFAPPAFTPPALSEQIADSALIKEHVAVVEPVPSVFPASPSSVQAFRNQANGAKVSRSSSSLVSEGTLGNLESTQIVDKTQPRPQNGWQRYFYYIQRATPNYEGHEKVIVSFIVKADGTLTDFKATGKLSLQQPAIEVVRKSPPWTPAQNNGLFIDAPAQVTIHFKPVK